MLTNHTDVPIHLQRGAGATLQCQLAARLAGKIRDGELSPGASLPSVRRLARELGVHRNTAWACYRRLERAGLVLAVQGRGVFVRGPLSGRVLPPPESRDGRSGPPGPSFGPPFLLEPWTDLGTLLTIELHARTGLRTKAVHPRCLEGPSAQGAPSHRTCLARPSVIDRLRSERRLPARVIRLELSGGSRELAIVARLRSPAVIAVLTRCASVRRYARTLARTSSRHEPGLASPHPADESAVRRATRIADLVFADLLCTRLVDRRVCRRLVELRLLSERTVEEVREAVKCRVE